MLLMNEGVEEGIPERRGLDAWLTVQADGATRDEVELEWTGPHMLITVSAPQPAPPAKRLRENARVAEAAISNHA